MLKLALFSKSLLISKRISMLKCKLVQCQQQKNKLLFKEYDDANTGFIEGTVAAEYLTQSGLPQSILNKIWELADVDKDGMLNEYEFVVATHLALIVQKYRIPLPKTLPKTLLKENIGKDVRGEHPMVSVGMSDEA